MRATYDPGLVALSIAIAVVASSTALALAGRVTAAAGPGRRVWLAGGALALGLGIWSMHFVGMLAYRLPVAMAYDVPLVLLSLLVAILASALTLWLVSRPTPRAPALLLGGGALGVAICGMHYLGMAAVRTGAVVAWDRRLVAASVVIALAAGLLALWLAFRLRREREASGTRLLASLVMGGAIAGMHYTAMAAAHFHPLAAPHPLPGGVLLRTTGVATILSLATLVVLGLALGGAALHRQLQLQAAEAEARRRGEARFRALVGAAAQIVWTATPQGEFSEPQPDWCAFTGQAPGEEVGRGWLAAVHPADREATLRAWQEAGEGRLSVEVEHRVRRHDGQWCTMRVRAVPVPGEAEWVGTHTDVTAQRQAEARLQLADLVVRHANNALMVTEAQPVAPPGPRIVLINEAFTRMTGYRAEEVMGRSPRLLQGPGTDRAARARIRAALERGAPIREELLNYRKDGTPFWVELNIVPVTDRQGRLTHFASFQRDTTARRRAEETALRLAREETARADAEAARALVASILESLSDAFCAVDGAWRITFVNRRAEELVGQERAQLVGASFWERFAPLVDTPVRRELERAMVERVRTGCEWARPGEGGWFEVHAHPSPEGLAVSFRDVTSRRRAEEEQRRLTAILEATPDFVGITDASGHAIYINRAGREMLGVREEDVPRLQYTDCHPVPVARRLAQEAFPIALREGIWRGESAVRTRAGEEVPVSQVLLAHHGPDGEVRYLSTIMRDITERKRVEENQQFLVEASRVLSGSLEYAQTLDTLARLAVQRLAEVCLVDVVEDGTVRRVAVAHRDPAQRARVEELRRWPPQPDRHSGPARVIGTGEPELVPEVTDAWMREAARDAEHLEVLRALHPRSLMVVPLVARGRTLGSLVLAVTGGGRRYGPAELRLAEELAGRAALAIDNARLYRQSQQATRLRDEVLAVVSHDLRSPLSSITLSIGILRRLAPEEPRSLRTYLDTISHSVQRANRLIHDLLDVARMEGGRLTVERAPQEVERLLEEALLLHLPQAAERSVQLERRLAPDLPPVLADRDRVLQVLQNLLGNALRFTPAGGRITLGAERVGGEVRLSVTDTGPGIPPEHLPHLFDPFWQAKRSRREGAGLGLAIARGIVEAHGGRLWVESTPGQGAAFFFTLPVGEGAAAPAGALH